VDQEIRARLLKVNNPFGKFLPLHELAKEQSLNLPEEEVMQDWIQNKGSSNGSSTQRGPITLVLPVSGRSVQI